MSPIWPEPLRRGQESHRSCTQQPPRYKDESELSLPSLQANMQRIVVFTRRSVFFWRNIIPNFRVLFSFFPSFTAICLWGHEEGTGAYPSSWMSQQLIVGHYGLVYLAQRNHGSALKVSWHFELRTLLSPFSPLQTELTLPFAHFFFYKDIKHSTSKAFFIWWKHYRWISILKCSVEYWILLSSLTVTAAPNTPCLISLSNFHQFGIVQLA